MDDLLQKGVNSYKSGDHETARKLFISATKQNPDSERAWGWLYNVCKTDQERIYCLRKIVKINPHNLKAQEILTKLTLPEDPPLEQPLKHNTQNPVAISYQSQSQQITVNVPWYRSTVAYVLFFLFITPLWTLLIFTDKRQGKGIRALGLVIGAIYLYSFCILPILTNNNYSGAQNNVVIVYSSCYPDGIGNQIFTGKVRNTGTSDLQFVELRATLEDNSGHIVNTGTGYIDSDILYAGQTSTFTIYINNPTQSRGTCNMRVEDAGYR